MPRHQKTPTPPTTTPAETLEIPEWMSQAAKAAEPTRWRTWWAVSQGLLSTTSLVVVVVLIATAYELQVGEHAGFGQLAGLVPFAVGPYVIWTWTDPRARWWDEVGAAGLLLASVALSVVDLPRAWLKLGVGVVLIVTEWRMVVRWRGSAARRDRVAEAGRNVAAAITEVERVRAEAAERVAALEADLAAERAARVAATAATAVAGPGGGQRGGPATKTPEWGTTFDEHVAWIRKRLDVGETFTGRKVQERMGLGSRKAGSDRLTEARRLHLVERGA